MWLRNRVAHPLDPLAGGEFRAVASILRREHGVGEGWRFASIELAEPSKTELRAFDEGGAPPPRRAEVVCLQRSNNTTYKSMVSLTDDRVESFEHIPGVQANFTADEFVECDQLLRTHSDVIAALGKRGVTDMDLVFFDTWTYGDAVAPPEYRDRRLGWSDSWVKAAPGANPYANLISGLHCVIDLNAMEVLWVEDNGGADTPEVMGKACRAAFRNASVRRRAASRSSRCTSPNPRDRRSRWTATCCSGRTGRCASASTTARE